MLKGTQNNVYLQERKGQRWNLLYSGSDAQAVLQYTHTQILPYIHTQELYDWIIEKPLVMTPGNPTTLTFIVCTWSFFH